jgi:trans-aconitate 2-methyltransferase
VHGVDSSAEMLAAAAAHAAPGRVEFQRADVRDWRPDGPVDVLLSNATLHWVPEHPRLLAGWAAAVPAGGWLAVQVPGNFRAPTHALLAALCRSPRWSARLSDAAPDPGAVLDPAGYLDLLTAAGLSADVWETTYLHVLTGPDPVFRWISGTGARPVLQALDPHQRMEFEAEYRARLAAAYPAEAYGTLLPFRRIFAVARRHDEGAS